MENDHMEQATVANNLAKWNHDEGHIEQSTFWQDQANFHATMELITTMKAIEKVLGSMADSVQAMSAELFVNLGETPDA